MSVTQAYKTINISDRAAFVELQTAILDYVLGLSRSLRQAASLNQPTESIQREIDAASRAMTAVMAAV